MAPALEAFDAVMKTPNQIERKREDVDEELATIQLQVGPERYRKGKYREAAELFDRITTDDRFIEFLTLPGYERLD